MEIERNNNIIFFIYPNGNRSSKIYLFSLYNFYKLIDDGFSCIINKI